jgi:hypothetical protein
VYVQEKFVIDVEIEIFDYKSDYQGENVHTYKIVEK